MNQSAPIAEPSRHVLVVDDEPLVLRLLTHILRDAGYLVHTTTNGVEAFQLFLQQAWALVITDRMMPQMDGEKLAEAIKETAPGTPVVLITGFPHSVIRHELFDAILAKPFTRADLLSCIDRVVRPASDGGAAG